MNTAGMPNGPERSSLIPKENLIDDYFEVYSEPHRRYQTTFDVPSVVFHLAGYLELAEPDSAADQLRRAFRGWQRRVPRDDGGDHPGADPTYQFKDFSPDFFPTFVAHGVRRPSQGPSHEKEALFFEASPICDDSSSPRPGTASRIVVRIEIHKGWYSATIFIPVTISRTEAKDSPNHGCFYSKILDNANVLREWSTPFTRENEVNALGQALNIFYDDLPRWLVSRDAASQPSASKLRRLIRRLNTARSAAPRGRSKSGAAGHRQAAATELRSTVFCDFIGLTLSVETVRARGIPAPVFLPDDSNATLADAPSLNQTLIYLDKISPALYRSVLRSNGADVVINYLRRGSAIYISNVGAQSTPDAKDPLRFLVLYPEGRDYRRPGSPALENRKWWLSRLIHRLLLAGTMRIKALHNLRTLMSAAERLRVAEEQIERFENDKNRSPRAQYITLDKILSGLKDDQRGPQKAPQGFLSLSAENRIAYQAMSRHLDDLEIVRIPGWQSYTAFVNRRLAGTYQKMSDITLRYDRIWSLIRARMDAVEAKSQIELQTLGTAIAVVGLPATLAPIIAPMASPITSRIRDIQIAFCIRSITVSDLFGGAWGFSETQLITFFGLLIITFTAVAFLRLQSFVANFHSAIKSRRRKRLN